MLTLKPICALLALTLAAACTGAAKDPMISSRSQMPLLGPLPVAVQPLADDTI